MEGDNYRIRYAPTKFDVFGDAEIEAVTECLRNGLLNDGKYTKNFELKIGELFGKKHGLFVNSGSSANWIACQLADIEGGDVITSALAFPTTISPVIQAGATPVLVDVEAPDIFAPSVSEVVSHVTRRTKAIFLANTFGDMPDFNEIRREVDKLPFSLKLIEDSADVISYNSIYMKNHASVDIATTSFYASHIVTAGGGGGMVMLNDDILRDRSRQLRDWGLERSSMTRFDVEGQDSFSVVTEIGMNLRSTEMNAAFGIENLKRLSTNLEKRKQNVEYYCKILNNVTLPRHAFTVDWMALPILHSKAQHLQQVLESNGVQTRRCFTNAAHQEVFRRKCKFERGFDGADRIMRDGLLLGVHQGIEKGDMDYVSKLIYDI